MLLPLPSDSFRAPADFLPEFLPLPSDSFRNSFRFLGQVDADEDEQRANILARIERNAADDRERVEKLQDDVSPRAADAFRLLPIPLAS